MIKPGILELKLHQIERKIKLIEDISPIIHIDIADGKMVRGETILDTDQNRSDTNSSKH